MRLRDVIDDIRAFDRLAPKHVKPKRRKDDDDEHRGNGGYRNASGTAPYGGGFDYQAHAIRTATLGGGIGGV